MKRSSVVAATGLGILLLAGGAAADVPVYSNDFETAAGPEWSNTKVSTTPGTVSHPADGFLGDFGNENVILTLTNLPLAHTEVTLSFDLFIIRTWDGNGNYGYGPDFWGIDEGTPPVNPEDWDFITTFNDWYAPDNQCYPDAWDVVNNVPLGDHPSRTGAIENDTLGFLVSGSIQDSVYHSELTVGHTGGTLTVTFGAAGLQELSDESWGLDDVAVEVDIPEPATVLLLCAAVPMLLTQKSRTRRRCSA